MTTTGLILLVSLSAWSNPSLLGMQAPPAPEGEGPARNSELRNDVNVRIIEYFNKARSEEHFRQVHPVLIETKTGRFTYDSECHWLGENTGQPDATKTLPFDVTFPMTVQTWSFPSSSTFPPPDPLVVPTPTSVTTVRPLVRDGSTTPSTSSTKSAAPGSTTEFQALNGDNQGTGPMVGPQLQVPLPGETTRWLPFEATASVYGSALFGHTEVYGIESEMESYGLGLRLNVPIPLGLVFDVQAYGFAGHGWVRTDFGDTTGVDTGAGILASLPVYGGLSVSLGVEARGYFSENVRGTGYGIVPGLNLAW